MGQFIFCDGRVKSCGSVVSMSWSQRTGSKGLVFLWMWGRLWLVGKIFQNCGQHVLDLENEIGVSICEVFTEESLWGQVKRGSILGKQGEHVLDLQNIFHGVRFCCGVRVWLSLVKFGLACCNCKRNPYRASLLCSVEAFL